LGVPGNISSSTLLHGIHLAIALENYMKGKVIGDDAFFVFSRYVTSSGYDIVTLKQALSNLGRIAPEKVEEWEVDDTADEDTWHYAKRPIVRAAPERMYFGSQVVWPSLANALDLDDGIHTYHKESLFTRRKKYASQCYRFLVNAQSLPEVSEEDYILVSRVLRSMHRSLDIPVQGFAPNSREHPFWVPSAIWRGNFIVQGVEAVSGSIISIPMEFSPSRFQEVDLSTGAEFCYKSIPALSILVKLGYVTRTVCKMSLMVSENWELVERFYRRDYGRYLYSYVVVRDVPEWSYKLLDAAHVPHERVSNTSMDEDVVTIEDILEITCPI